MKNNGVSTRLIIMNFLQYAIWGAYLTSMGSYLVNIGLGAKIGIFTQCRESFPYSCLQ